MCDQTEVSYLPEQIVWVKLSNVWWPAQVVDQETLDEEVLQGLRKRPLAVVKFFNEDYYEFVKSLNQIYHYNCRQKNDFIKKGLDLCRSQGTRDVPSSMKKFPEDIKTAETLTGGDPDIIKDPIFESEPNLSLEVKLGFKKTPKSSKKERSDSKSRNSKSSHSQHEFLDSPYTNKNHESYIRIQRMPFEYDYVYKCGSCNYSSTNPDLLEIHSDVHSTHDTNGAPLRYTKHGVRIVTKKQKSPKKKHNSDRSVYTKRKNMDESESKRPKKKSKVKHDSKQNNEALRENILKDWMDDSGEENEDSALNDSFQDESINHLENNSDQKNDSSDQNKSCFDFEDEEETINLDSSMKFGQKLPRVISDKPKKHDILDEEESGETPLDTPDKIIENSDKSDADDVENDKSEDKKTGKAKQEKTEKVTETKKAKKQSKKEVESPLSPKKGKKQDQTEDIPEKDPLEETLSKEFSDLLDDTQVPQLPDIPDTLFPTVKSPKKPFLDETKEVEKILESPKDEKKEMSPIKEKQPPKSILDFSMEPLPEDDSVVIENLPKSWDKSPLKKRRGSKQNFFVETDKDKPKEEAKVDHVSPFKKRKNLEPDNDKAIKDSKNNENLFLEQNDTPKSPSKEPPNDSPKEVEEGKAEEAFLDAPKDAKIPLSKITETIQVNPEESVDKELTISEGKEDPKLVDSEMILEENIVIEAESDTLETQTIQGDVEKMDVDEKIESKTEDVKQSIQEEKAESKSLDPSEMELDINSMPFVMDDDLISDLKRSILETPTTSNSVKKIKIQLKKAGDSKLPPDLSLGNGMQVISIPGKLKQKPQLKTVTVKRNPPTSGTVRPKVSTTSVPTIFIQSPSKNAAEGKTQKILLVPAETNNGQSILKTDDKLIKTPNLLNKTLVTQPVKKSISIPGKQGFVVKRANLLSTSKSFKPVNQPKGNLLTAATTKQNLPNILVTSQNKTVSNQTVKLVSTAPKVMQIQRPGFSTHIKLGSNQVPPLRFIQKQQPKAQPSKAVIVSNKRPAILQKTQRRPVQKKAPEEVINIPVVQNIQPESEMKMVYLAVDGAYHPINNSLVEGGNSIFLDNSGDVNKLFLSIDGNGQLINISTPSTSTTTTKTPPRQDILAKALANTQVLQNEPSEEGFNSNYPPPLTLSHNVLETSFTINQPIMTPQEVPSSITPEMAGLATTIVPVSKDPKDLQPSMPLLSEDLEGRTVYITDNPSHQQFTIQVLNDGSLNTSAGHVIYTTEQLPSIETIQKKAQEGGFEAPQGFDAGPKTEYRVVDSSEAELKDTQPNVEEHELVVEQVDSLNEPYLASSDT